jgi:ribosome biogenesis GTPase / thiamine phosphate phosphatase
LSKTSDLEKGIIVKSTGKSYKVLTSDGSVTECSIKGRFRVKDIKTTNPLAVGDNVLFVRDKDGMTGVITTLKERRNYIIRRSINLSKEAQIIAANIDLAAVMVSLINPETPLEFIDRFLATAEAYNIPAAIIFNKTDLHGEKETEYIDQLCLIYEAAGYKTIRISVIRNENIGALIETLKGKTSLLAGNSGVGKSSLLNVLNPSLSLKTESISNHHKQGVHTTTFPEMHLMPFGGAVIDTPGIRGFGVIDMDKEEIYHFFPEIFLESKQCRFNNCLHVNEPDCAVIRAVEVGKIAWSRYRSYLSILEDGDERYR